MPTYKVSYPYLVVEAPDEKAAVRAYRYHLEPIFNDAPQPNVEVCGDVPDFAVDADGYDIVEDAALKYGCTPSMKHPGRCAECGEPMSTREEEQPMPKYHVHIYPVIRVLVPNIVANSQAEACEKAESAINWDQLFSQYVLDYADEIDGFLVDEDGDTEHEKSTWYDDHYRPR